MKYFVDCKTIEQLKAEYKRLAKLHHPDCGGDTQTMQEINAAYDLMFNRLNATAGHPDSTERPEDFRNIIDTLLKLHGLTIEVCGRWIWVSGDTYPHRDALKGLGFKWAANKKMWYLGELTHRNTRTMSMDHIRARYGSQIVTASEQILSIA